MAYKSFSIGDLVWAKMKGYAPWPAMIHKPPEGNSSLFKIKRHQYYVYFFGTKNYAWISNENITRHSEEMVSAANMKKRTAQMKIAINEIVQRSRCSEEKDNIKPVCQTITVEQPKENRKRPSDEENAPAIKKQRKMPKSEHPDLGRKKMSKGEQFKNLSSDEKTEDISNNKQIETFGIDEKQTEDHSSDEQAEELCADESIEDPASEEPIEEVGKENDLESETERNSSSEISSVAGPSGTRMYTNATISLHADELARAYIKRPSNVSELKPARRDTYSSFMDSYKTQTFPNQKLSAIAETTPPAVVKRPSAHVERPPLPELDITTVCDSVKNKDVVPPVQKKNIGVLGVGSIGRGIVKSLINTGHNVMIWNRTEERCLPFVAAGVQRARSPAELVKASDFIFSCLKDASIVKQIVFGSDGVIKGFDRSGKSYVEMTPIDPETSEDLFKAIEVRGGRYLEASFYGTSAMAENGELLLSISGNEALYTELESCFKAISQFQVYTGTKLGASSVNVLALTMMDSFICASFSEVLMAMKEFNINQNEFYKVVQLSPYYCDVLKEAGTSILSQNFSTKLPVTRVVDSLKLASKVGKAKNYSNTVAAAVRGLFSRAEGMNYGGHDMSSVYMVYDQYRPEDDVSNEQVASSPETITIDDDDDE